MNKIITRFTMAAAFIMVIFLSACTNPFAPNFGKTDTTTIDTTSATVTTSEPVVTTTLTSVTGIESSLTTPVYIGDITIAAKYSGQTEQYHNIDVSVTEILRGDEAATVIDDYNKTVEAAYKIQPIDDNSLEYCVLKYNVALPEDFPANYGISPDILVSIINDGELGSTEFNDVTYYINQDCTELYKTTDDDKLFPESTAERTVYFVLPISYSNYFIRIGYFGQQNAYIVGK